MSPADSIKAMGDNSAGAKLEGAFGTNAWLVEEMYESYLVDASSVSESWRDFFADYRRNKASEPTTPGGKKG